MQDGILWDYKTSSDEVAGNAERVRRNVGGASEVRHPNCVFKL